MPGSYLLPFALKMVYPEIYFPSSEKTRILTISNHIIFSYGWSTLILWPYSPTAMHLQTENSISYAGKQAMVLKGLVTLICQEAA